MKITPIIVVFLITIDLADAGSLRSPREFDRKPSVHKIEADNSSFIAFPFLAIVLGYQYIFGPIKGSYCPMYPSCSNYGYEAIQRYNIKGVIMTVDRLHRCAHDLQYYDKVIIDKQIKNIDLVK